MATEEQVSEQGVKLGPQTPAARRRARALPEEAGEPPDERIGIVSGTCLRLVHLGP